MCEIWTWRTTKYDVEKLKITPINGEIYPAHGTEDLILLGCHL